MSAIGNNGTLYRPQLVEKIVTPDGAATVTFKPEVKGKLPISNTNLRVLQDAMRSVVENKRGTGYYFMTGLSVPVSAKTGTATNPFGNSHAWFAGYTSANNPEKPDLAIAVLCENCRRGFRDRPAHLPPGGGNLFHRPPASPVLVGIHVLRHPHARPHCDPKTMSLETFPGIVTRIQSGFHTVQTEEGTVTCHLRGRLKRTSFRGDVLAVGDQVMISLLPDHSGMIEEIIPRQRALVPPCPHPERRVPAGTAGQPQPDFTRICLHQSRAASAYARPLSGDL